MTRNVKIIEAKTMLELFEGHPSRWTQRVNARPRRSSRRRLHATDSSARCWCLNGALIYVYGTDWTTGKNIRMWNKLWDVIQRRWPKAKGLARWNDQRNRTFKQVLDVVREAGV